MAQTIAAIISQAMSELGKRRAAKVPKRQRDETSAKGGKNAWKGLSKAERSKIMKARARVRANKLARHTRERL